MVPALFVYHTTISLCGAISYFHNLSNIVFLYGYDCIFASRLKLNGRLFSWLNSLKKFTQVGCESYIYISFLLSRRNWSLIYNMLLLEHVVLFNFVFLSFSYKLIIYSDLVSKNDFRGALDIQFSCRCLVTDGIFLVIIYFSFSCWQRVSNFGLIFSLNGLR